MSKAEIKTKMVVQYNGHNVRKGGDLDLNFKTDYSEIVNTLSLMRMLNQNINIKIKIGHNKPETLGTFSLKNVNIDRDGESKIKFNSEMVHIDTNKLLDLLTPDTLIIMQATAVVDIEDEPQTDDDDEEEGVDNE